MLPGFSSRSNLINEFSIVNGCSIPNSIKEVWTFHNKLHLMTQLHGTRVKMFPRVIIKSLGSITPKLLAPLITMNRFLHPWIKMSYFGIHHKLNHINIFMLMTNYGLNIFCYLVLNMYHFLCQCYNMKLTRLVFFEVKIFNFHIFLSLN